MTETPPWEEERDAPAQRVARSSMCAENGEDDEHVAAAKRNAEQEAALAKELAIKRPNFKRILGSMVEVPDRPHSVSSYFSSSSGFRRRQKEGRDRARKEVVSILRLYAPDVYEKIGVRVSGGADSIPTDLALFKGYALVDLPGTFARKTLACTPGDSAKLEKLMPFASLEFPELTSDAVEWDMSCKIVCGAAGCMFIAALGLAIAIIATLHDRLSWTNGVCKLIGFSRGNCTQLPCALDVHVWKGSDPTEQFNAVPLEKQFWDMPLEEDKDDKDKLQLSAAPFSCCGFACCTWFDDGFEEFCDNWGDLGRSQANGDLCPSGKWRCRYKTNQIGGGQAISDLEVHNGDLLEEFILATCIIGMAGLAVLFSRVLFIRCGCDVHYDACCHRFGRLAQPAPPKTSFLFNEKGEFPSDIPSAAPRLGTCSKCLSCFRRRASAPATDSWGEDTGSSSQRRAALRGAAATSDKRMEPSNLVLPFDDADEAEEGWSGTKGKQTGRRTHAIRGSIDWNEDGPRLAKLAAKSKGAKSKADGKNEKRLEQLRGRMSCRAEQAEVFHEAVTTLTSCADAHRIGAEKMMRPIITPPKNGKKGRKHDGSSSRQPAPPEWALQQASNPQGFAWQAPAKQASAQQAGPAQQGKGPMPARQSPIRPSNYRNSWHVTRHTAEAGRVKAREAARSNQQTGLNNLVHVKMVDHKQAFAGDNSGIRGAPLTLRVEEL